jgi:hypothetical protein
MRISGLPFEVCSRPIAVFFGNIGQLMRARKYVIISVLIKARWNSNMLNIVALQRDILITKVHSVLTIGCHVTENHVTASRLKLIK